MRTLQPYKLVAEIEMFLGVKSELVETDLDQATRVLEEAVSMLLLQFLGDGGRVAIVCCRLQSPAFS